MGYFKTSFPKSPDVGGERGFTLVEVIIAIVLFAIIAIFMGKMYAVGTTHVVNQGDRRKATHLADEAMEEISSLSFTTIEAYGIPSTTTGNVSDYSYFNEVVWFNYVEDGDFTATSASMTNSIHIGIVIASTKGALGFQDVTLHNVVTNWE